MEHVTQCNWKRLTKNQMAFLLRLSSDIFIYLDEVHWGKNRTASSLVKRGIIEVGEGGYGLRYEFSESANIDLIHDTSGVIPDTLCESYFYDRE